MNRLKFHNEIRHYTREQPLEYRAKDLAELIDKMNLDKKAIRKLVDKLHIRLRVAVLHNLREMGIWK